MLELLILIIGGILLIILIPFAVWLYVEFYLPWAFSVVDRLERWRWERKEWGDHTRREP